MFSLLISVHRYIAKYLVDKHTLGAADLLFAWSSQEPFEQHPLPFTNTATFL